MLKQTLHKRESIHLPGIVRFTQHTSTANDNVKTRQARNKVPTSVPGSTASNKTYPRSYANKTNGDSNGTDSNAIKFTSSRHDFTYQQKKIEKVDIHACVDTEAVIIVTPQNHDGQRNDDLMDDIIEVISGILNEICTEG